MEGAGDGFGNSFGSVDLFDRFGDLAEEFGRVDLLKGFAAAHRTRHLAKQQDHRRRFLARDMKAGRGVGRAGPARRHHDAGPSGELAPGLGGHRGAALLATDGDRDRRIVEAVQKGEIRLAGHAECAIDAISHQRVGEDPPAGPRNASLAHNAPPSIRPTPG